MRGSSHLWNRGFQIYIYLSLQSMIRLSMNHQKVNIVTLRGRGVVGNGAFLRIGWMAGWNYCLSFSYSYYKIKKMINVTILRACWKLLFTRCFLPFVGDLFKFSANHRMHIVRGEKFLGWIFKHTLVNFKNTYLLCLQK